jgi:serine protease
MSRTTKMLVALAAVVTLASAVAVAVIVRTGPASPPVAGPLSFHIDPALRPSVPRVDPLDSRTVERPVGALAGPDGAVDELVLDEVIVHTRDQAELDAFLGRWHGTVLDSFPADADGRDHLVRVDVSRADPTSLPADLLAAEPTQTGAHRVSDDRALRLLALAAAEWRRGTEVVLDWLSEPASIESGEAYESKDITENGQPKNVFDWSYMRSGGAMDIGVGAAWQLLQTRGKLKRSVRYLVMDGGFSSNPDFPDDTGLRKASWGEKNPHRCTGGASCPYHGTEVVLAAMAQVDNGYGTAGPAGPVVSRLIAVGNSLDYWSRLRRLESVAKEERPDIVNLSFTNHVGVGGKYAKTWTDRRMRHVRDTGALIVAAAGNDKRSVDSDTLFVPCESSVVMCVGGMDGSAKVASGSNFGEGDSTTSVEIYGPMCVRTINDPNRTYLDLTTKNTCGTSVASPFVGGVAALVMAANPSLSNEQVRKILNDTAHVGGLGSKVTGSQRRINALAAVAKALGVTIANPTVRIEAPANGKKVGPENWVDLRGTATDFMGRAVKISWSSDRDGPLTEGSKTSVPPLSVGNHVITATATDTTGRAGSATVTLKVVDTPPEVKVVYPLAGMTVTEGSEVSLVGTTMDPDNWQSLPGKDVSWVVKRGASVVHEATGHESTVPKASVVPGSYTVRFTAGGVTAQTSFTVKAVPPGQHAPKATITKPAGNLSLGTGGGQLSIEFRGRGTDADDGTLSGRRFRWTASSGAGRRVKVLCTGSAVPTGKPPGGVTVAKDCGSFTAQLGIAPADHATSTWTVRLEVFDSTGLVEDDTVTVTITLAVP